MSLPAASSRKVATGFTLIEIVVTVVIMSVLIAILTTAFPVTRANQYLILAEQQIQFMVRDAQKRALNEERVDECVRQAPRPELEKLCSDIGLAIEGPVVILFADTDNFSDEQGNGIYEAGQDYDLELHTLPNTVEALGITSYVFRATPPHITMTVNGRTAPNNTLTLRSGQSLREITLESYGNLERK